MYPFTSVLLRKLPYLKPTGREGILVFNTSKAIIKKAKARIQGRIEAEIKEGGAYAFASPCGLFNYISCIIQAYLPA